MTAKSTGKSGRGPNSQTTGKLRIIGGEWRGRRFPVADLPGLRPTTDRIRETVFNWLAPELAGRRCLDLFAGTGALGLEALSRGAVSCHFIDLQTLAVQALEQILGTLRAEQRGVVIQADAVDFLKKCRSRSDDPGDSSLPFELVFLDPPFNKGLLEPALEQLNQATVLSDNAILYVESAATAPMATLPDWAEWKSKQNGGVSYALYRRR